MLDPKRFWLYFGATSIVWISALIFWVSGSLYSWMIIPVFSGLAILIGNPPAMLWYGMSWFMVTQYAQTEMRVGFFNYLDEFVTLGMLAVLMVQSRGALKSLSERMAAAYPLQFVAVAFVVLSFVSAILNHAIDIYFVMWCFQYLRMFVVFFFTVRFARKVDLRKFITFLMAFSILFFVMNLTWKLGINPLPNQRGVWASDFGIGTFAACDQVAYFCVMVMVLCLAIIIDPPDRKLGRRAGWVLLFTFVDFMLTNTIHAFFLLGPAVLVFFVINYQAVMKVVSWPTLMGMMSVVVLAFLLLVNYTDAGSALKWDYVMERYEQFQNEPKMNAYRRSVNELPHESNYFWFTGHGPGMAGSSIGRALRRPIADKYFNTIYNEEQYRNLVIAGSVSSGEQTGLLTYWSETGPLGLAMLLVCYAIVLVKTKHRILVNDIADKTQLALARSLPSIILVVMLIAFIRDMFYIAWFAGVCWVWAGMSIIPIEREAKKTGLEIL